MNTQSAWPEFDYSSFKSTNHLLHMMLQLIGKLKLVTPFEPHWSNVALWLTSRGLTTGLIPYGAGGLGVEVDLQRHEIALHTTWDTHQHLALQTSSVADLTQAVLNALKTLGIQIEINMLPQEVPNPIPFNQDRALCEYHPELANAWWRILVSSHKVMKRYHARFDGESPPVGLMWGTLDLRDARYNGIKVKADGPNAGYIRRNAMDEAQVEVGFWAGNEAYPRPAYFSFIYPEPTGIEKQSVQPQGAYWHPELHEFILDYDVLRQSGDPDQSLLDFFDSTYHAGADLAGWKKSLNIIGEPL